MPTFVDTAPCYPIPSARDLNRTGEAVAGGWPATSVVVPDSLAASPPTELEARSQGTLGRCRSVLHSAGRNGSDTRCTGLHPSTLARCACPAEW